MSALGQSGSLGAYGLAGAVAGTMRLAPHAVIGTHSETNVQHDGYGQVRNINSVHFRVDATPT